MKNIEIYAENRDYNPFVKSYESEHQAVDEFLKYHATHNTMWDGMPDEQIREEITLEEIAGEYFGSWGRVRGL